MDRWRQRSPWEQRDGLGVEGTRSSDAFKRSEDEDAEGGRVFLCVRKTLSGLSGAQCAWGFGAISCPHKQ